jgi:hypothetical protein
MFAFSVSVTVFISVAEDVGKSRSALGYHYDTGWLPHISTWKLARSTQYCVDNLTLRKSSITRGLYMISTFMKLWIKNLKWSTIWNWSVWNALVLHYMPVIRHSHKRNLVYSEQLFFSPTERLLCLVNSDIRKFTYKKLKEKFIFLRFLMVSVEVWSCRSYLRQI